MVYNYGGKALLMGKPFGIFAGVEYELSDKTNMSATLQAEADYNVELNVEHQLDSNWTVSANQSFDSSRVEKGSPYHIGFTAAYKL